MTDEKNNGALDPFMAVKAETDNDPNVQWLSATDSRLTLEGLAFRDTVPGFRRMPASTPELPLSRGVDNYSNHASGVMLRFRTDSPFVKVRSRVRVLNNSADVMRMGRMGFDLYAGSPQSSGCVGVSRMNFDKVSYPEHSFSATLIDRPNPFGNLREFQLNFPLYAEVLEFQIGLCKGAVIAPPTPRCDPRPVVFYGTSVEQGCCASRPGLSISTLLSRYLNREFYNFGFAGSGKGEPEIAKILSKIAHPALYVVNYDGNVDLAQLKDTLSVFVGILREAHPETPVLTVSLMRHFREFPLDKDDPADRDARRERTKIHQDNVDFFRSKGDNMVHFFDGQLLYGNDFAEAGFDMAHSNDIGLYECANALKLPIAQIIPEK